MASSNQPAPAGETPPDAPPLVPLVLYMEGCATQEEMNHNLNFTMSAGYKTFADLLHTQEGSCSIVGSGPSIEDTWTDLKGDIIAINSSLKYLLDNGVVPKYCMIWDADPICEAFAVPHPDVTYLIASRCHQKVFEKLSDCTVYVWHAGGDHNIAEYLREREINEPMINGGSAGVTRCLYLAAALGYTDLHVFGGDSCYRNGKTHIRGSLVPEKDIMVSVGNNPPIFFRTTPEWCAQVNEFRDIYVIFNNPAFSINIAVYGDSMLGYMWELLEAKKEKGLLWQEDGLLHPSNQVEKPDEAVLEELKKQGRIGHLQSRTPEPDHSETANV